MKKNQKQNSQSQFTEYLKLVKDKTVSSVRYQPVTLFDQSHANFVCTHCNIPLMENLKLS